MASNYPGSLDSFDTIASDKKTSDAVGGRTHRAMHNDLGDAIEAIETELGITPSGSESTVAARLTAIESGARMGTGSIGATALANDAVDTAAIQDGAVTSAKIADGTITATDVVTETFAPYSTIGNLLTSNQASVETDTTGFYGYQTTQVRSTAQAVHGAASLLVTATATGLGSVYAPNSPSDTIGADPGAHYTASVEVMGGSGTRSVTLGLLFYTAGGSQITRVASAAVSSPASWTPLQVTAVAPANAAFVAVDVVLAGGGSVGDSLYCDAFSLHKGAGGQWAMPGTPITGLSEVATNNAVHLSGTGSPGGVITAAPGSTWLQTDATTDVKGWIRWIKATGTGNTGWIAGPEADTEWRNVAASINADWTLHGGAGALMIRRVGSVVSMAIGIQRVTASGARNGYSTVYTVPTGFLWKSNDYATWAAYNDTHNIAAFFKPYYSNAQLDLIHTAGGTYTAGESVWAKLTWTTNDAWPTSLPGSGA